MITRILTRKKAGITVEVRRYSFQPKEMKCNMNKGDFLVRQLSSLNGAMSNARAKELVGSPGEDALSRDDLSGSTMESAVLKILEQRAHGETLGSIAQSLNRLGIRGRYGGRWYMASVRAVLRRRAVK
ncbi:recombinase family protein [Noviherbaspirillum sp. Root189]|uniref:recombinase family protein n=1 Tax=Noviherbaspirillum sp. Root189 TaxID=1736487 RepID=UPI00138F1522|nr:recombinase family protein [Noviherbaspirillum sp. Root189]